MGWEESIFKYLFRITKGYLSVRKDPALILKTVQLSEVKDRLSVLAKALTGENIEILTAEKEGGFQNRFFFLPISYSHGSSKEENQKYYIFRILYLSEQKRLGLNWPPGFDADRKKSLKEASQNHTIVLENMRENYPGSIDLMDTVILTERLYQNRLAKDPNLELDQSLLHGLWMSSVPQNLVQNVDISEEYSKLETLIQSEEEGVAREKVQNLEIDKKSQQDYTLQHHFEKVDTIEEFKGNWRDFDGSDEMGEQKEALKELDLRNTVRSDEPTHSIFRTEFLFGSGLFETENSAAKGKSVAYDEWDYSKRRYKKGYCKVFLRDQTAMEFGYFQKTLSENISTLNTLKTRFNRFANEFLTLKRQSDGEELDLDALVDYFTDLQSNYTPSEQIYISKRKRLRNISILVLIDTSLSTDSFVANHRILDVEKSSLVLFGQICSEFGDRFQIDSFSSRTRNHCDYVSVKSFSEPWSKAKHKIGAIEAGGYTRIGPAIRHGLAQIQKEDSSTRWILLLSDGKPNDYDRYEGRYGMEDVKQAIRECEKSRVGLFALAIDKQAKQYLPSMLGIGSYKILPNPTHLPDALADFYMKVLR